jgi:hypothetical protein
MSREANDGITRVNTEPRDAGAHHEDPQTNTACHGGVNVASS